MDILGLAIAAAIPIVMFALWAEYFRAQRHEESDDLESEADRDLESTGQIARVRLAGLMATTLQLVVFLATSEIRLQDSVTAISALWITLVALIAQRWIQIRLERELIPVEPTESPQVFPVGLLWAFMGMAIYLGVLGGCILTSAAAVALLHLSTTASIVTIAFGALFGYSAALAVNFALSPWLMSKILPSFTLQHTHMKSQLEKWFSDAGVEAPEFRVVKSNEIQSNNAWLTGFPRRLSGLKPVLWLTPAFLKDFESSERLQEIEAIMKHEAAHLKLNHLARRFALAWSLSLAVLFTLAGAMALNYWLRNEPIAAALPIISLLSAFALLWGSIRALQNQSRKHEIEADIESVSKMGASAQALISALTRLHELNPSDGKGTHPSLEERIRAVEPWLHDQNLRADRPSTETKKAA